jgi:vaccinia related kinase
LKEPHQNGPLFVEMHFYMRVGKKEDIDKFKTEKKLKNLGMPQFLGSGSQDIEGMKHRFLVMPRYGRDIWKIFEEQNRQFPLHTVYRLGIQLLNVLEYIHSTTYVHMDLKGSNVLLGFGKGGDEHVYLLDYGLACHYSTKEYKIDPKKAHNGTIEYTSRDAHNGVPTMRGDIEILAYNLIEWAGATLPWTTPKTLLTKPTEVQKMKESFMKDVGKSLKDAFGSTSVPSKLAAFMKYVEEMKHDTQPDYSKIRGLFESGLKELKASNSGKLEFVAKASNEAAAKSPVKRAKAATSTAKDCPSPTKKPKKVAEPSKDAAGPSKDVAEPSKKIAEKKTKAPAKQPKIIPVGTDSSEDAINERSKRARPPPRYVDLDSDSEEEEEEKKKAKKKPTLSKSADKNENKNTNSSASPPPKKEKASATAKGQVVLKSKSTGGTKKTVQLNFDLDISYDSDLVVTVNRKDKKKKTPENDDSDGEKSNRAGYYKGKFAKAT